MKCVICGNAISPDRYQDYPTTVTCDPKCARAKKYKVSLKTAVKDLARLSAAEIRYKQKNAGTVRLKAPHKPPLQGLNEVVIPVQRPIPEGRAYEAI